MSAEAAAPPATAWKSRPAWIILVGLTLLGLVIDLGSKSLAFSRIADEPVVVLRSEVLATTDPSRLIPPHEPVTVAPGLLNLTLVLNPGAVFGAGAGMRWFFVGFTVIAVGFGLYVFGAWTRPRDVVSHVALALLLSGGIGNLYDRLVFGCVRDFLHPLPGVEWPFGPLKGDEVWPYVSNIADLFLLIGIGVLVVTIWRQDASQKRAAKAAATEEAAAESPERE